MSEASSEGQGIANFFGIIGAITGCSLAAQAAEGSDDAWIAILVGLVVGWLSGRFVGFVVRSHRRGANRRWPWKWHLRKVGPCWEMAAARHRPPALEIGRLAGRWPVQLVAWHSLHWQGPTGTH